MSDRTIAVVRKYFDALAVNDLDTVGALLSPDVVWHQPGANRFSGRRSGSGSVFAMIGGMVETSGGTFRIDRVDHLMGNGDLVAATIHFTASRDGAELAMDGVDLLRVVDDLIVEVWLFGADQPAEDEFWGS